MEECRMVLVTPEIAKHILKKNSINRSVKANTVKQYAYDMKKGEFKAGYDPIVINKDGYLENGQHRLCAVIESGVPTRFWVIFGAEPNIESYDRGASRSCSDNLQIRFNKSGITVKHITTKVSIIRFILNKGFGIQKPSDSLIAKIIQKYDAMLSVACHASVQKDRKGNRALTRKSPVQTAIFCAYFNGVSEEDLVEFCSIVNTGFLNEKWQTAPIVLRNELMSAVIKGYQVQKEYESVTEQAIKDFVRKYSRKRDYDPSIEPPYFGKVIDDIAVNGLDK